MLKLGVDCHNGLDRVNRSVTPGWSLHGRTHPIADGLHDLVLVDVDAANTPDLIRRPSHHFGDVLIGQTGLNELRAKGPAEIVNMLLASRTIIVDVKYPYFAAHLGESMSERISGPRRSFRRH